MATGEIIGSSILVLMFSLAGALIVNLFLGFGIRKESPLETGDTKDNDLTSSASEDDTDKPASRKAVESNCDLVSSEPVDANTEATETPTESDNNWRCACEGGFLPPGMLKSFGGAEAVMRLGTGQCYHKQAA